jgi:hypothetical protein
MSVSAIQSHAATTEHGPAQASQKTQGGGSKANTAQANVSATRAEQAQQTQAAATAQNHAGHEQGNEQKNGGQGGRVNLYA